MAQTIEGVSRPNVTQASFLEFIQRYRAADEEVEVAVAERKNLRKIIKGAGHNLRAFDRARKDSEKAGAIREEEDAQWRQMMMWLGMPVGTQAEMDFHNDNDEDREAIAKNQIQNMRDRGYSAGKSGQNRGSNPARPGSFLAQQWDEEWMRGQEELAQTLAPDEAPPPAKRRGRPRKNVIKLRGGNGGARAAT